MLDSMFKCFLCIQGFATMHFTSIASADGSKLVKCAHWVCFLSRCALFRLDILYISFFKLYSFNVFIVLLLQIIVSGSFKSMATRSFGSVLVEPSYLSYVVEDDYTFLQLSVDSTGVALIF